MIRPREGFQTGNKALVAAAADQMHQNAADVRGNNIPVNGGAYNVLGATAAQVLATTGDSHADAAALLAAMTAPASNVIMLPNAAPSSHASADSAMDAPQIDMPQFDMSHQHAHHPMWA